MKILVTGASGQLGAYVLDRLSARPDLQTFAWSGSTRATRAGVAIEPVDLLDSRKVAHFLDQFGPDAVLHLAAISSAEAVRLDAGRALAINVESTRSIARWCSTNGRRLVFASTDLVFGGDRAYRSEADPARPTLAYGRTKLDAERAVEREGGGRWLVARLPLMFGPSRAGRPSFFDGALATLRRGEPATFFEDEYRTPLDYASAASILVDLLTIDVGGLLHVAGPERLSRFDLMRRAIPAVDPSIAPDLIRAGRLADATFAEPRPVDVSLDTSRLRQVLPELEIPTVEEAMARSSG